MAAAEAEKAILEKLDSVLESIQWKGPPSDISHLNDPDHLDTFKRLSNNEEVISKRISSYLISHGQKVMGAGNTIRVCSIGCQDGSLDRNILAELGKRQIEYVGLESDEDLCESASEKLGSISSNISVSTTAVDYEEDDLAELSLAPFDLVWIVNCSHYADQLGPLLQGAAKLLKPSGILLAISSSKQSLDELITRFWSHQRPNYPLHTTETIQPVLTQLGLSHTVLRDHVTFDITDLLEDDFQSLQSLMVLDHLVFCRLADYPPEVLQLVVQFLKATSHTNSSDANITLISSVSDMIAIQP